MIVMMSGGDRAIAAPFREIWLVDFEFRHDRGERPWPVCMVARELRSGREIRLWRDELLALDHAPFDTGRDCLFVAYAAVAEIGCFLELGWPLPANILDLYFEHRCETNGIKLLHGNNILGALAHRGLPHIDAGEKAAMMQLIIGQQQWPEAEQRAILDYNASDVDALATLLPSMVPTIDWDRALVRGRYAAAVAEIERTGVSIDRPLYGRLQENWRRIMLALIEEVDAAYSVYDGATFKHARFASFLAAHGIAWPRTPSGRLAVDDDTFKRQAQRCPILSPLRELRVTLDVMREVKLPIGVDGHARCSIKPFMAVTGRNQPSTSEFIFGPAKWLRGLIRPPEGYGMAHIDFSAQEIGIAAGLSGDEVMIGHYRSGDPYLAFGKKIGLAPADATIESHGIVRDRCKAVFIGVNYGMGGDALAAMAGITRAEANELLRLHRATYPRFWRWSDEVVTRAMLTNRMTSVFGWQRQIGPNPNPRSLAKFPMQSNGAEMMRIAAIAATEGGIEVCAPVHDAFLIAAPLDRLDEDVARMREIMTKAGNVVTDGLDIRTEAKVVRWPDRYMADGGEAMWLRIMALLDQVEASRDR
jgi:hypothetical protein